MVPPTNPLFTLTNAEVNRFLIKVRSHITHMRFSQCLSLKDCSRGAIPNAIYLLPFMIFIRFSVGACEYSLNSLQPVICNKGVIVAITSLCFGIGIDTNGNTRCERTLKNRSDCKFHICYSLI